MERGSWRLPVLSFVFESSRRLTLVRVSVCPVLCAAPLPDGNRERYGLEKDSHGQVAVR